ncbi:tetratricopeptide repeat protein [Rhizobium binxianense]
MRRHHFPSAFRSIGPALVANVCLALSSGTALASPVSVEFLPPAIESKEVCVQRLSDADVIGKWKAWDGKALPKEAPWLLMREAQRLRDIDAAAYFPVVSRIFDLLPKADPSEKAEDLDAERITLYLRAGRIEELKKSRLIDNLMARGAKNSPKDLNLAAQLILNGVTPERDEQKALSYLVDAAYGGNPDALLELARRNINGETIDGWMVDPSLAVTMAFGAMVGKLDAGICDRVTRIAREYEKGDIVAMDRHISEQWLRFAADLGDGNAAWKVARYHLESADIEKDNKLLIHYLQYAADHGVIAAQSEIAHAYEVGAIVPRDLAKSEFYYKKAVSAGHRNSLIRLTNLYETSADKDAHEKFVDGLRQLAGLQDPPGWAFSKLGNLVIEEKGIWAGESEAAAYFEKGTTLRDMTSMVNLADIRFRHGGESGAFDDGINLLMAVLDNFGRTDAMIRLRDAYLCRAASGPQTEQAAYWADAAKDSISSGWSARTVEALADVPNPTTTAELQSQALNGQANAVAAYLWYLQASKADAAAIAEWQNRVSADPDAEIALADLMLQVATDNAGRRKVLDMLARTAQAGVSRAKTKAAEIILTWFADDAALVGQAEAYLAAEAARGSGEAMELLSTKTGKHSAADVYAQYAATIEERGDAEAMIFAARQVSDPDAKRAYLIKAGSTIDCSFDSSLALANTYLSFGDQPQARRWMDTAEAFSTTKSWRMRLLAEAYANFPAGSGESDSMRLFEAAAAGGDSRAEQYLLKTYMDAKSRYFSQQKAADLMVAVISDASPKEVVANLARLERSHKAIREQVLGRIDVVSLYEKAALAGDPVGMREYGKLKLARMTAPGDAVIARDMFQKAADNGDPESMVLLAKNYAFGIGTEPSLASARRWLQQAASLGNQEAKEMLAVMTVGVN